MSRTENFVEMHCFFMVQGKRSISWFFVNWNFRGLSFTFFQMYLNSRMTRNVFANGIWVNFRWFGFISRNLIGGLLTGMSLQFLFVVQSNCSVFQKVPVGLIRFWIFWLIFLRNFGFGWLILVGGQMLILMVWIIELTVLSFVAESVVFALIAIGVFGFEGSGEFFESFSVC